MMTLSVRDGHDDDNHTHDHPVCASALRVNISAVMRWTTPVAEIMISLIAHNSASLAGDVRSLQLRTVAH